MPVTAVPMSDGVVAIVQIEPDAKFCNTVIFRDFAPPERYSANVCDDLPDLPIAQEVVSLDLSSPPISSVY